MDSTKPSWPIYARTSTQPWMGRQNTQTYRVSHPTPRNSSPGHYHFIYSSKVFMKPAHIQEILSIAKTLHDLRDCHVRLLSKLAGLIISRSHCLGPAARMRTRAMYSNIEARLQPHEKTPPGTHATKAGTDMYISIRIQKQSWHSG